MITTLVSYLLLSLSMAAPVGPVNIAQMDRGLKFGFMHAWFVGIGGMAADLILMTSIFFGLTDFLTRPYPQFFLWTAGFFILVYMGLGHLRKVSAPPRFSAPQTEEKLSKSFSSGFWMALTNPMNVVFWVGIYGSVLAATVDTIGKQTAFLFSCIMFLTLMISDLLVASSAHYGRTRMNAVLERRLALVAGVALISFGLYFGWKACFACLDLF